MDNKTNELDDIITQAKNAKKAIAGLDKMQDEMFTKFNDDERTDIQKIEDKVEILRAQIDVHKSEEREVERHYEQKRQSLTRHIGTETSQLSQHVEKFDRMLALMGVHKQVKKKEFTTNQALDKQFAKDYEGKKIAVVHQDEGIWVCAYTYRNRKSVNRYTLAIAGRCIFNDEILKLPKDYHLRLRFKEFISERISVHLKDAPDESTLLEFFERWKKRGGLDLTEYFGVLKEYQFVRENCIGNPKWERQYLLSQKYYYENEVSRGTDCKEYKTILRQLKNAA